MATYTVIPQADQTFRIAIVGDDGAADGLSSDAVGSLITTKLFARPVGREKS
jgi:hypothetical protein